VERIRRRLGSERGIALVLALAFLLVLSIVVFAAIDYGNSTGRSAKIDQIRTAAYGLAEAGVNDAISVLANSANDPTSSTLLGSSASPRVETFNTGTVSTYGVLNSSMLIWTITATSTVRNPTGAASLHRTVTAQVQVSNTSAWNKIYNDDASACMTVDTVDIPSPFSSAGCVTMKNGATLVGSPVEIGGNVTLDSTSAIGASGTPIAKADISGTCKYNTGSAHTPCSSVDHVYAGSISSSPSGLSMPTFDWSYWYQNAAPGPRHPCTSSTGTPPQFDKDTTYNHNNPSQEITPEASNPPGTTGNSSYTCQVWSGGTLLGELDWNNQTRVLTIDGTVFFDGDAVFHDSAVGGVDYFVHVNGRGTIMTAGNGHIDEVICEGGSGTTDCRTNMSNWNPAQNLLVYVAGGAKPSWNMDVNFHEDGSAFQGILYCVNHCTLNDSIYSSGPVLAGNLDIGTKPAFSTWPSIATLPAAEVAAGGPWTVSVLSQTG
jgi:Tfp pilus assembly protein PilX